MTRPSSRQRAHRQRRVTRGVAAAALLITALVLAATVATRSSPGESRIDNGLPNPMGGPARTAPGDTAGDVALAGLQITGTDVRMGEVALGVTYVPSWEVTNPTDETVSFLVGQPQVLEGCCPGPGYADGELTQAGQELTVPPDGELLLQFPLQMHAGMDGPHHLAVPLAAGGEETALHVTGDFTSADPA